MDNSIPSDLKKILVLDKWYHRNYTELAQPQISDDHLRYTYEFNKNLAAGQEYMDYETWQLIAKVIVTGDISDYKPTLAPNTHWKNWPESGSL